MIQQLPLAVLDEDPRANPNSMDAARFDLLCKAIEEAEKQGAQMRQPILVRPREPHLTTTPADGRFYIVDGAHRKRACERLGFVDVPCVVEDLTDQRALVARIAMNRLRGDLDMGVVATQLAELNALGWSDEALTLTGFGLGDVSELLSAAAPLDETSILDLTGVGGVPNEPEAPKPFLLELTFATRDELAFVKKRLRKAAGGRGGDMAKALTRILEGT